MTPETIGTAWGLIIGAVLILAGVVVIHLVAYGRERRDARRAREAIDLARVRAAFETYRSTEPSPEAKVLTLPGCKPGVPTQRGPSGASSRFMLSDAEWDLLRSETSHADGWES